MFRLIGSHRIWSRHFLLPKLFNLTFSYSTNFKYINLQFQANNQPNTIQLPASIRIRLSKQRYLDFLCYNLTDARISLTWLRVLRHIVWGALAPFTIFLEVRGLGYRLIAQSPNVLEFGLGFSHAVLYSLPPEIKALTLGAKGRAVQLCSANWLLLTQTVAMLTKLRKTNSYKEKGVFKKWEVSAKLKSSKRKKN